MPLPFRLEYHSTCLSGHPISLSLMQLGRPCQPMFEASPSNPDWLGQIPS